MPARRPFARRSMPSTARWPHLRHQCQQAALGVLEERHPLFQAVRVPEDQMRRSLELDAAGGELVVRGADVVDAQIQDRLGSRLRAFRAQVEPRAAEVEERELAERVEMLETQNLAVPGAGFVDIADRARYLANG